MPSSATTRNKLEKQAVGENSNTWGTKLNTDLDILDAALDGVEPITMAADTTTLTNVDYTADQAKNRVLWLTGTSGTIVIPNVEKLYLVHNEGTGDAVISTGSGTTVTIPSGVSEWVWSTGSNVVKRHSGQANRLATARTIALSNGATGTATAFDGTANISIHVSALHMDSATAGTLAVARGGTGVTTSTGTGSNVLSDSPALSGTPTAPTATAGTNTTQIATTAFVATAVGSSVTTASGTYTPTVASQSDMVPTFSAAHYMRVGNTVTMSGKFTTTIGSVGEMPQCTIDTPIASAFTNESQAAGCGQTSSSGDQALAIKAGAANRLDFRIYATTSDNRTFFYTVTYQVI